MRVSRYPIDAPTRRRLAGESGCTEKTLTRYLEGLPVNDATVTRLTKAAKVLGIDLPPAGCMAPKTGQG